MKYLQAYLVVAAMLATVTGIAHGGATDGNSGEVSTVEEMKEHIAQRIEEVKRRLELTDAQVEAITPIASEGIEAQRAVLARYGIDLDKPDAKVRERLGFRKLRELGSELAKVRAATEEKLEDILSKEQMKTFKAMQEEQREAIRRRLRARQK